MANKELKSLLGELENQGFSIEATKKGYFAVPPDPRKPKVAIHKTPSDHKGWANMISQLRRCGFIQK